MLTKLSTSYLYKILIISILVLIPPFYLRAQTEQIITNVESRLLTDSARFSPKKKNSKPINLVTEAKYSALDSLIMDKQNQKAYLYNEASIEYDGIVLVAKYIEIDFANNTVFAQGLPDSNGVNSGLPQFTDHGDTYNTTTIFYNFNTKKGIISGVTRKEGEINVYIDKGKKMTDNITYVQNGYFSTCDLPHPHYSVKFKKGKIIPNDKIVTGPIYMEIEGIPLPIVLPFGLIPNSKKRSNGILIPSYGYAENRGYNLTNGGYYWGLGQHADLALRADIYSRGSWGLKAQSRYNFRYHGNGNIDLQYANNYYGETDMRRYDSISNPPYSQDHSFFIRWRHDQDAKANPYSRFSANVNMGSTQHNQLNSTNTNDYLTNTFQSSVSYNATLGKGYNFTGSLNHSQNTQTGIINLTLPQISFSTPRFKPLARKKPIGPRKWYENISLSYTMDSKNTLDVQDSLFKYTTFKDFDKGIQHSIPISSSIPLGSFNWTNSINFKEYWYFSTVEKYWQNDTVFEGTDTIAPHLVTNVNDGFKAAHQFDYNSSINTRIYGMYMIKKGPVKAIRHVVSPSLSFNYRPDFGSSPFNYYQEYVDKNGDTIRYSMFEGQMYGSPPDGKSGSIGLSIDNNLEMKVNSKKDTITGVKKIKIIESLSVRTSYNLAAKEFALAPLSVQGRTVIFKGLNVTYSGTWDFYARDSIGKRINVFNWDAGQGFLRKNGDDYNVSFNYQLSSSDIGNKEKKSSEKPITARPAIFDNIWNFNLNYTFRFTNTYNATKDIYDQKVVQTLGFSGSLNVTEKWKIGATTGWDFVANNLSFTSVDIYRDMHCWEMLFNWIPIGPRKSYNLTVRVKASMLQDLKLERSRNWRDY